MSPPELGFFISPFLDFCLLLLRVAGGKVHADLNRAAVTAEAAAAAGSGQQQGGESSSSGIGTAAAERQQHRTWHRTGTLDPIPALTCAATPLTVTHHTYQSQHLTSAIVYCSVCLSACPELNPNPALLQQSYITQVTRHTNGSAHPAVPLCVTVFASHLVRLLRGLLHCHLEPMVQLAVQAGRF